MFSDQSKLQTHNLLKIILLIPFTYTSDDIHPFLLLIQGCWSQTHFCMIKTIFRQIISEIGQHFGS